MYIYLNSSVKIYIIIKKQIMLLLFQKLKFTFDTTGLILWDGILTDVKYLNGSFNLYINLILKNLSIRI